MFRLGGPELAVIVVLALLIFGPSQIPKLGRTLGDTVRAMKGVRKEMNSALDDDKD